MAAKIKPCPLCGARSCAVKVANRHWNIVCGRSVAIGCGLVLRGEHGVSRAKMVARWNSRTSERNSDGV